MAKAKTVKQGKLRHSNATSHFEAAVHMPRKERELQSYSQSDVDSASVDTFKSPERLAAADESLLVSPMTFMDKEGIFKKETESLNAPFGIIKETQEQAVSVDDAKETNELLLPLGNDSDILEKGPDEDCSTYMENEINECSRKERTSPDVEAANQGSPSHSNLLAKSLKDNLSNKIANGDMLPATSVGANTLTDHAAYDKKKITEKNLSQNEDDRTATNFLSALPENNEKSQQSLASSFEIGLVDENGEELSDIDQDESNKLDIPQGSVKSPQKPHFSLFKTFEEKLHGGDSMSKKMDCRSDTVVEREAASYEAQPMNTRQNGMPATDSHGSKPRATAKLSEEALVPVSSGRGNSPNERNAQPVQEEEHHTPNKYPAGTPPESLGSDRQVRSARRRRRQSFMGKPLQLSEKIASSSENMTRLSSHVDSRDRTASRSRKHRTAVSRKEPLSSLSALTHSHGDSTSGDDLRRTSQTYIPNKESALINTKPNASENQIHAETLKQPQRLSSADAIEAHIANGSTNAESPKMSAQQQSLLSQESKQKVSTPPQSAVLSTSNQNDMASPSSEDEKSSSAARDLSSARKRVDATSVAFVERLRGAAAQRKLLVSRKRDSLMAREKATQNASFSPFMKEWNKEETPAWRPQPRSMHSQSTVQKVPKEEDPYVPFKARKVPISVGVLGSGGQTGVPKVEKPPATVPRSPILGRRRNSSVYSTNKKEISKKKNTIKKTRISQFSPACHQTESSISTIKRSALKARPFERVLSGEQASREKDRSLKQRQQEETEIYKRKSTFRARPLPMSSVSALCSPGTPLVGLNLLEKTPTNTQQKLQENNHPNRPPDSARHLKQKSVNSAPSLHTAQRAKDRATYQNHRAVYEKRMQKVGIEERRKMIRQTSAQLEELRRNLR